MSVIKLIVLYVLFVTLVELLNPIIKENLRLERRYYGNYSITTRCIAGIYLLCRVGCLPAYLVCILGVSAIRRVL